MSDDKWASITDLCTGIPPETLEHAMRASHAFVWDATCWSIELSSSTSGMYGKWRVSISPMTTVKDVRKTPPVGIGGDLELAFLDFTKKMHEFNKANGFKNE